MHSVKDYSQIQPLVQPGDIFAFGGKSLFSRWAKFTTRSMVTHVAMVIHAPDNAEIQLLEATYFKGKKGVMTNYLSERIKNYKGDIWWLPLGKTAKLTLQENWHDFTSFYTAELGKSYDVWQLFGAAIDRFDDHPLLSRFTYNRQKFNRWFCSELVAEGLNKAGVIDTINASETTPIDVCRFNIYAGKYAQIVGKPKPISQYNQHCPSGWGLVG